MLPSLLLDKAETNNIFWKTSSDDNNHDNCNNQPKEAEHFYIFYNQPYNLLSFPSVMAPWLRPDRPWSSSKEHFRRDFHGGDPARVVGEPRHVTSRCARSGVGRRRLLGFARRATSAAVGRRQLASAESGWKRSAADVVGWSRLETVVVNENWSERSESVSRPSVWFRTICKCQSATFGNGWGESDSVGICRSRSETVGVGQHPSGNSKDGWCQSETIGVSRRQRKVTYYV